MVLTNRIVYDSMGNIISETDQADNGVTTKKITRLTYDENKNISKVETHTETIRPDGEVRISDENTKEYEYQDYYGKYVVSKTKENEKLIYDCNLIRKFKTVEGSEEDEATSHAYIYNNSVENPELINKITFSVTEYQHEKAPKGFNVFVKQTTDTKTTIVEEHRSMYGSTEICGYQGIYTHDRETGEDLSKIYTWEDWDSSPAIAKGKEYFTFTIRKGDGSKQVLNDHEFICGIEIEFAMCGPILTRTYPDGRKEIIIYEDKSYGTLVTKIEDLTPETHEEMYDINSGTVRKFVNDEEIFHECYSSGKKLNIKNTEYENVNGEYKVSTRSNTEYKDEQAYTYTESFIYDRMGRIRMQTLTSSLPDSVSLHKIFEYDDNGNCTKQITENTLVQNFYNEKNQKVFSILNQDYPMSKEIFDFHFSKVLDEVTNEEDL